MINPSLHWRLSLTCGLCLSAALLAPLPAQAQEAVADSQPMAAEQPAAPDAPAAEPTSEAATGEESAVPLWHESLMFDPERAEKLMQIYEAYLAQMRDESADGMSAARDIASETLKLLNSKKENEQIDLEIFNLALNSILYNSRQDWSIWVNGQRHHRKEAQEGFTVGTSRLRVTQISPRQVTYVWTPSAEAYPDVKRRLETRQQVADQMPDPRLVKNARITLNEEARQITVTQEPNQVFQSGSMTVVEGRQKAAPRPAAVPGAVMPVEGGNLEGLMPPGMSMPREILTPSGIEQEMQDRQEQSAGQPALPQPLPEPEAAGGAPMELLELPPIETPPPMESVSPPMPTVIQAPQPDNAP